MIRKTILPLLATGLVLAGCAGSDAEAARAPESAASEASAHAGHGAHGGADRAGLERGEPTDLSIYNLTSHWVDQTGEARPLGSLAGRVQVMAMVYTHCGHACPQILVDLKRIEARVAPEGDRVGFVMVSIDPERDTPERLDEYARTARLDPLRWTLLTAEHPDLLELGALLGVRFKRESETDFSHSNVITVLNAEGEIVHQQIGLNSDPHATIRVIEALLAAG